MSATLDALILNYSYGKMPVDFNEFTPKFCVISGITGADGNYDVDLSEIINRDGMGDIQSVVMTLMEFPTYTLLNFIFGQSDIIFSVRAFSLNMPVKCIFPYFAPRGVNRHRLYSGALTGSAVANVPFQLVFTNIPLPITNGYGVS